MEIISRAFLQQNNHNCVTHCSHHSGNFTNTGVVINFGKNQINYESLNPSDEEGLSTFLSSTK